MKPETRRKRNVAMHCNRPWPLVILSALQGGTGVQLVASRSRATAAVPVGRVGPDAHTHRVDDGVTDHGGATGEVSRPSVGDTAEHPDDYSGHGTWAHLHH